MAAYTNVGSNVSHFIMDDCIPFSGVSWPFTACNPMTCFSISLWNSLFISNSHALTKMHKQILQVMWKSKVCVTCSKYQTKTIRLLEEMQNQLLDYKRNANNNNFFVKMITASAGWSSVSYCISVIKPYRWPTPKIGKITINESSLNSFKWPCVHSPLFEYQHFYEGQNHVFTDPDKDQWKWVPVGSSEKLGAQSLMNIFLDSHIVFTMIPSSWRLSQNFGGIRIQPKQLTVNSIPCYRHHQPEF